MASPPQHGQKLTLLEVVLTLGVIAILAALLLPYLSRQREWKHRAACLSNLKQIGLAAHLYSSDWREVFPVVEKATSSNGHLYLLLPNYMTANTPFVCPSDATCRSPARGFSLAAFDAPNVNSYAYVAGLTETAAEDSPLAGDNLMDVSRADSTTVLQYQERVGCSTKGSDHGDAGANVVFVDGHALWNDGRTLKTRWSDKIGVALPPSTKIDPSLTETSLIKNPNGL